MFACLRPLKATLVIVPKRRPISAINSPLISSRLATNLSPRGPLQIPRSTFTTSSSSSSSGRSGPKTFREIWAELRKTPLQYATIPAVAAFLGLTTNWMGVNMLFYPIEYTGTEWYRSPLVPYGVSSWKFNSAVAWTWTLSTHYLIFQYIALAFSSWGGRGLYHVKQKKWRWD